MQLFVGKLEQLERFRLGDPEVLTTVYEAFVHQLDRYIRALVIRAGHPELVERARLADLRQEVFMRVFSESSRLSFRGPAFAPYLNRVARNYVQDELKRKWREVLTDDCSEFEGLVESPEQRNKSGTIAVLSKYVASLAPPLREIYLERFVRGASQQAASSTLGITRRKLRTRELHLKNGLRRALVQAGFSPYD